jgi:hypothetical protein
LTTPKQPRRYASGTTVDVGKSRIEVERYLMKHGAHQVVIGTDSKLRSGFVAFSLEGRQYRIRVPPRESGPKQHQQEQAEREQWRALVLLLKAKLEVVASGFATVETEFLAYVVLANGSTVGDEIAPRLHEMYQSGEMPRLLPA